MDALSRDGKRISLVTPTLVRRGGTEVYLERLLRIQRRLGMATRLFTADDHPDPDLLRDPPLIHSPRRHRRIERLAAAIADGAHWVEFHHAVPRDLVAAVALRAPTLLFLHTARLTCPAIARYLPRGGVACLHPPGPGCWLSHLREGCLADAHALAPLGRRRSARLTVAPVSRVVFNSEALRRLFERTVLPLGERGRVLPPPHHFPYVAEPPPGSTLLFIGRLFREKGVLDAVEAAARLPGAPLHLYGAGRDEGAARALAERLGVEARFHGQCDDDTVAAALAGGGCLLLPSRLFEAWGMVGPEAIAQGCPVVAYDSGGVGEWLAPEFGERVPPGDIAALADAARRQLARAVEGRVRRTAWRRGAEGEWGMEAFARRYVALIDELPGAGR